MGELTKTDNAGKNSPGPVYMFSDNVKYDQVGIFENIHFKQREVIKFIDRTLLIFIFNFIGTRMVTWY